MLAAASCGSDVQLGWEVIQSSADSNWILISVHHSPCYEPRSPSVLETTTEVRIRVTGRKLSDDCTAIDVIENVPISLKSALGDRAIVLRD